MFWHIGGGYGGGGHGGGYDGGHGGGGHGGLHGGGQGLHGGGLGGGRGGKWKKCYLFYAPALIMMNKQKAVGWWFSIPVYIYANQVI